MLSAASPVKRMYPVRAGVCYPQLPRKGDTCANEGPRCRRSRPSLLKYTRTRPPGREPPRLRGEVRRELEQHRAGTGTQAGGRVHQPPDGFVGIAQPFDVGEKTARLHREHEPGRRALPPLDEALVVRQPVERVVQLDGRERLGVGLQPPPPQNVAGKQDTPPCGVLPSRGSDHEGHDVVRSPLSGPFTHPHRRPRQPPVCRVGTPSATWAPRPDGRGFRVPARQTARRAPRRPRGAPRAPAGRRDPVRRTGRWPDSACRGGAGRPHRCHEATRDKPPCPWCRW